MKVENMTSPQGNKVANQFIIRADDSLARDWQMTWFQSYNTIIAKRSPAGEIWLDRNKWDYSKTTSKYRNIFLGETTAETKKKIASGKYILTDLNS